MIARSIDITYPKAFTRDAIGTFRADLKLIPHTGERWMRPMFDLDPAIEPAGAIGALAVFRDQTFEPHQAGVAEQVRADPCSKSLRKMPSMRRASSRAICLAYR